MTVSLFFFFCALFLRGGVKDLNRLHTLEELLLLRCGREEWAWHRGVGGARGVWAGPNGLCPVYTLSVFVFIG